MGNAMLWSCMPKRAEKKGLIRLDETQAQLSVLIEELEVRGALLEHQVHSYRNQALTAAKNRDRVRAKAFLRIKHTTDIAYQRTLDTIVNLTSFNLLIDSKKDTLGVKKILTGLGSNKLFRADDAELNEIDELTNKIQDIWDTQKEMEVAINTVSDIPYGDIDLDELDVELNALIEEDADSDSLGLSPISLSAHVISETQIFVAKDRGSENVSDEYLSQQKNPTDKTQLLAPLI